MQRMSSRLLQASSTIIVRSYAKAQLVTLSRPSALNALDMDMIETLLPHYQGLHQLPAQSTVVLMKGDGGKAFCAGGDVVSLAKDEPKGVRQRFFYREYQLDYAIATLKQPHIAIWDGIVMGGGVGVSVHGSHRVCTEATLFAMPETAIGLFPDVGGSYVLPRLPHPGLGLYLALTGARLKGADVVHAGIGTHFVPKADIGKFESRLVAIEDPSEVATIVQGHATPAASLPEFSLQPHLPTIAAAFGNDATSVEDVLVRLDKAATPFAAKTSETIAKCSPTALKLSFRMNRLGLQARSLKEVFEVEYRASQGSMAGSDFFAGVKALLIDKTGKPQWQPASLGEVTDALVEKHLAQGPVEWDPTRPFPERASL